VRRATAAVVGTIAGTVLLVGAKLGTRPPDTGVLAGEPADLAAGGSAAGPNPSTAPTRPSPATASTPSPRRTAATAGARGGTAPRTSKPPAPSGTGLKNGTFAGTEVSERYGRIRVTIAISGGRITDVTATYPTGGETGSINARAIPRLRQAALTAQSAKIDTVSGATYTSEAYQQSLQSAIDRARA
jgi:uncharacterized protein with FMN-binding domain